LRLTVEKLVYGGDGLGRMDGRVVMTPFVLPGEEVRAEPVEERTGLVRARLLEVSAPAPERVAPPCPYFARCGGCHYQHAPYEYQVAAKRAILADQLRRIGKFEPPADIGVIAGEPWNYRNRAQFHVEGTAMGYLEAQSHRLCDVEMCPISSPRLNEALAALRGMLYDRRWPRFIRSLMVFTNERQVQMKVLESSRPVARRFFDWCAEAIPGWEPGAIDYPAAGFVYRVSRHSFFQVNRFLAGRLVEAALEGAAGDSALDLYAGVGLFALPLAQRFRRVTAVESGYASVRDMEFSAERAGLTVTACHDAVEAFLDKLTAPPDFVLADPPRAGIGRRVARRLAELAPPRITLVSCDPATLARDLADLLAAGYRIERLTMVDLFPQTYHLETVARLVKG
jgi:23S rRNA (uracil1939-C5)-methyltransferase